MIHNIDRISGFPGLCITIGALCVFLLSSCEKVIDFDYHDIEPLTVIEGELTSGGARIGITFTTPMDEPMDRTLLTDASVTITDLTDSSLYRLAADAEGYFTDPTPGIPGHRYRLTVERDGNTYSMETTMYPPTEIVSAEFNWISMPYDKVAVFQARYLDNTADSGDCYWVKLYRNGEIYSWQEQDDRVADDGVNTFFSMTSRMDTDEEEDDEVLFDGDVMTVTVTPISREMHDYLEALRNDSNGPFLFSGPRVLGYFLASDPVSRSVTFHPDEIPEYK
ncbi:MAG: DUF4249 domain-containing protein [Muribaculaceae bacterium]|nr:DUF4249 domain-containing protein [Muribaculaceae bacterium]